MIEENAPLRKATSNDYGIVRDIPAPDDVLYSIDYDHETGYLKLNGFRIMRFQWENTVDKVFSELFKQSGSVKQIELDGADANAIINNIKMPLSFRKAVFRTSENGKKLQVTTKVTRARLKQFRVKLAVVDGFITEKRDAFYKSEKD